MANNDPVSGLYAAMSKVRQRRPGGTAEMASTAEQAGTVLPQPKVQGPQAPSVPASYREVLPVPAPQMPVESPVSPVEESIPASGPEVVPLVAGAASALMKASVDMSYADAYLLGLGYLFGIEPDQPAVAEPGAMGTVL